MIFKDQAMSAYFMSMDEAAQELAGTYAAQFDSELQRAICRKHGIELDELTESEFHELEGLACEYARQ